VTIRTLQPITKGKQVFINVGAKSNFNLLPSLGFSLVGNALDLNLLQGIQVQHKTRSPVFISLYYFVSCINEYHVLVREKLVYLFPRLSFLVLIYRERPRVEPAAGDAGAAQNIFFQRNLKTFN
jgi:hypothetical protein